MPITPALVSPFSSPCKPMSPTYINWLLSIRRQQILRVMLAVNEGIGLQTYIVQSCVSDH